MSRKPRQFVDSGIYHVILRGNNRQNLFIDETDRKFFIERLKKYSAELKIDVYAYCLMNNHVHILIGNGNDGMSLLIQKIANSSISTGNMTDADTCFRGDSKVSLFKTKAISKLFSVTFFRTAKMQEFLGLISINGTAFGL